MPYSPPNTFVNGTDLLPEEWNENVRAIADFYNESLDYTEITNASISTRHINRPTTMITSADTYQTLFESETIFKTELPAIDTPEKKSAQGSAPEYLPGTHMQQPNGFIAATTQSADYAYATYTAGNTEYKVKDISKTGMTVVVPHNAKMVQIHYCGEILAPAGFGDGGVVFYIGIDGEPVSSTLSYVTVIAQKAALATSTWNFNRRHFTLNYLWKGPIGSGLAAPTILNISLMGGSKSGVGFVGKISGIVEVIY